MAKARALNAYVLETPENALGHGARSDARLAKGEGGSARRRCRSASRICSAPRACARRRARTSSMISFRPTSRPSPPICGATAPCCSASSTSTNSPWARRTRPPISARWSRRGGGDGSDAKIVPGGSSGGSAAAVSAGSVRRRHRHRYRRLDPPAGGVLRHRRHQADLWPLLALGHRRLRLLARPGRPVCPHRARLRAILLRSMAGHDPKDTTSVDRPVPDYEQAVGASVKGKRHRHSEGISPRGMAPEIEALWQQGVAMAAATRGAEIRRHFAAAYQIRVAGLLHRGAGGGLVQSRALRRRPLRPAGARQATSSTCTKRPARKVSARKCAAAS